QQHPSKVGAAILVVEVTLKPVDFFSRVDNRGTPARGPLEYLSSTTFNNLFGGHEALTLTAAGAFKTRELQFYGANYRQVLNPEGLTYFANAIGGINQLYFVFSQGVRGLGATQNGQDLASRANGRVDFSKMELTVSRVRPLPLLPGLSGLVAAYGQYAMTPLLVSELCGYGGRLFGRGFDPSQFVGDSCLLAMFELRYDIPIQLQSVTQTQLYGFF